MAEDIPAILARREAGEPARSIAESYGVSQPLIYQVFHGWVPRPKADINHLRERQRAAAERGLKATVRRPYESRSRKARTLVTKAIEHGELLRGPCYCGRTDVEAHHHNGYAPGHELDVVWLCPTHHKKAHVEMRAKGTSAPYLAKPSAPTSLPPLNKAKLPWLYAPDDDCAHCHHDRQQYHSVEGVSCRFPTGGGKVCGCRRFRPSTEPLVECFLCGHTRDGGHAVTPCDATFTRSDGRTYACGCLSFVDPEEPF